MSFDTGDEKVGTYQFLDSITEAMGWDTFPYPTSIYEHHNRSYQVWARWIKRYNMVKYNRRGKSTYPAPDFPCFDYCQSNENVDATCTGSLFNSTDRRP